MVKYIFDLDHTLYSSNDCVENDANPLKYYNSFKHKNFLKQLLSNIDYNKYILTNANLAHAKDVLKRLDLSKQFKDIISTDESNCLKPDPIMYSMAVKRFKIKPKEVVYFFEDQRDNLLVAKRDFNWVTILIINEKIAKPAYVDYIFPKIEDALLFFTIKNKFDKNL
jgi:FMN phosphatase YigB (HAD superfamily)